MARNKATGGRRFQRLLPLSLSPATSPATLYAEQLSIGAGRRALSISLAVLITAILLFLLLSFGLGSRPKVKEERVTTVSLEASEVPEQASEASHQERERAEKPSVAPQPPAEQPPTPPLQATPLPPPPVASPLPAPAQPTPLPAPKPPAAAVRPPGGAVYGPPDTGGSPAYRDTPRVGTAPNGQPMYAAAWYREPSESELRGYLSTASGPGWGLIACRTAPDYRVEDCVGLDEYPGGSQIMRAVLAAAWQFKVRPPRVGGQSLVGSWVRIRIDYGTGPR